MPLNKDEEKQIAEAFHDDYLPALYVVVDEILERRTGQVFDSISGDLHSVISFLKGNTPKHKIINYIRHYLLTLEGCSEIIKKG